ncbi:NAD(P)-dependent oxidoreductase [Rhodococcus daqingensis]|uniref:NAD(P)-dependent oxidoreductase n=1 Tax=Rhodococcus daqingensis TaxID=2479363 RepID=A0ABW2RZU2_9NOCA
MKVLVIGATGGSGRAVVAELLGRGHSVTAFSRHASELRVDASGDLRTIDGDATDSSAVEAAVRGHDAVVLTLGISENAMRVRLFGPAHTAADVRSRGTRNVVAAMKRSGSTRLVVQSTYGVGETAAKLGLVDRIFFAVLIKQQAADHTKQESIVRASGLDWTIVQPMHLTDDPAADREFVSTTGEIGSRKVSRRAVGRVLADASTSSDYLGTSIAVSASS